MAAVYWGKVAEALQLGAEQVGRGALVAEGQHGARRSLREPGLVIH